MPVVPQDGGGIGELVDAAGLVGQGEHERIGDRRL